MERPSALCILDETGESFLEKMASGGAFQAEVLFDDIEGTPRSAGPLLTFRILYMLWLREEKALLVRVNTKGFVLPPGFQHGEYRLKFEGRICREIPPETFLSSEGEMASEGEALTDVKLFWKRPGLTLRRNEK